MPASPSTGDREGNRTKKTRRLARIWDTEVRTKLSSHGYGTLVQSEATHSFPRTSPLVHGPGQRGWWVTHVIRATAGRRSVTDLMGMVGGDGDSCHWTPGRNAGDFLSPTERRAGLPIRLSSLGFLGWPVLKGSCQAEAGQKSCTLGAAHLAGDVGRREGRCLPSWSSSCLLFPGDSWAIQVSDPSHHGAGLG